MQLQVLIYDDADSELKLKYKQVYTCKVFETGGPHQQVKVDENQVMRIMILITRFFILMISSKRKCKFEGCFYYWLK